MTQLVARQSIQVLTSELKKSSVLGSIQGNYMCDKACTYQVPEMKTYHTPVFAVYTPTYMVCVTFIASGISQL